MTELTLLPFTNAPCSVVDTIFTDDTQPFKFTLKFNDKGAFWCCDAEHVASGYAVDGIVLCTNERNTRAYPALEDLLGSITTLSLNGQNNTPETLGVTAFSYKVPVRDLVPLQRSTDFTFNPGDYIVVG